MATESTDYVIANESYGRSLKDGAADEVSVALSTLPRLKQEYMQTL
jgi:hypothetical protein